MAALVLRRSMQPSVFFLTLLLFLHISRAKDIPTTNQVEKWATHVSEKLLNLNMLFDNVQTIYKTKAKELSTKPGQINAQYVDINEASLVKKMAEDISELLQKQMKALGKSVEEAEKAAALYKWDGNLAKDDVTYENSKELYQKGVDMVYIDRFKKEVNFNFSSIHIPVEIYDGSIDILNGLNWTAALDEQFKKNHEENPDMLWQYFGSQTGFMRTYPATAWPTNGVDLYDVRRQSWYTQGSSSPKDMMILIDTSGSTHGQSLQLMQNAVKSILDTLGENDFVNIISFAEEANFVSKCLNRTAFVQANFRNKKQLERDIDKLAALGQADFTEAIRFAFEKFKEFEENETNSENNIGANCNKVIMLLTDGGTDNALEVFEKYNWPNKTVRVFTYAVGPTPNPTEALRWMACANRGYFSQIPAMGAIRARVQDYTKGLREMMEIAGGQDMAWEITYDPREYIPVLSRPQVIKNKKVFEWGNIYEDYLGLGMTTTVTLPVYNRSLGSSNQTILGVMAIDVTTTKLEAKTPFSKIGPNGYSFAINPNGYVVFHPNLKTTGKFMTEPPNIDLLELEVDHDNEKLKSMRASMIEGRKGNEAISTLFLSPDRRYVSFGQAEYAYTPIENTTFRLGLSVPIYQKKHLKFTYTGSLSNLDWSRGNSSAFRILIAPWEFHKNVSNQKDLISNWNDLIELMKTDQNLDHWNLDLLLHLYWDITHIEDQLEAYLRNASDSDNSGFEDIFDEPHRLARFIMTNGGMTLVSPPSEADYFEARPDPRKFSLYRRALHSPGCIFMADYSEGKRSNVSATPFVVTACGIFLEERNDKNQEMVYDKPAVVGERLSHAELMNAVYEGIDEETKSNSGILTCRDESLLCFLVDDGGFLVATNREDYREQIGRFLGQVDPVIFSKMIDKVFAKTVQYDFQATCKERDDTTSAGFKDILVPSLDVFFDMLNVGWWSSKVTWAFTSLNVYSWWNTPKAQVYAENESREKACVKATQQYYRKQNMKPIADGVQCLNCTRNFTAVKLSKTNLLLVVADPWCEECEEFYPVIDQAPKEISEEEEEAIICDMADNPRKRVQAYTCYHSDPREDVSVCGCADLRASPLLIFLVVLAVVRQCLAVTR